MGSKRQKKKSGGSSKPVHIFISDIHMTDQQAGSPVSDEELQEFASDVGELCKKGPVKLILLGDIIDFLRSKKWLDLWDSYQSAPWSGASKNFEHFCKNYSEDCAVRIANDVAKRYQGFAGKLNQLVQNEDLTVLYVPGNHDFMVQLSPHLRHIIKEFLSLSNDPTKEFPTIYQDKNASVHARHGNSYDSINWHKREEGYWALGDAIVLRIVNRFATEATRALKCAETSEIGQILQEFDNIEPLADIPVFVLWVIDDFLTYKHEKDKLREVWIRVVKDFLELKPFSDEKCYQGAEFRVLRKGLELSTKLRLSEFLVQYASLIPKTRVDYRTEAEKLSKMGNYRFIVFGHTHEPLIVPLSHQIARQRAFYINTGSWRKIVTRPSSDHRGPFIGVRVGGTFRINPNSTNPSAQYELIQRWHVS